MKGLRIIGRSFTSAGKSVFRNFSLSLASIMCTVITLILVSIGILLSYNIATITDNIAKELTIVVFMERDTTVQAIENTKVFLKKVDNVETVTFKSKDTVKEELANENETFSRIIDNWNADENPLQDSFIIKVKDVKEINETVTTIKNMDYVNLVKYGESMIAELIKVFDFVKNGTLVLVIALILVTAFLINNTIKITIFSRRNEIDIMRLVGTSNSVIKLPFLIEGFLIGIIGSILPILVTIFGYEYAYNKLDTSGISNIMSIIKLANPSNIVYITSVILLAIGAGVGMFGSIKAVRKYLTI